VIWLVLFTLLCVGVGYGWATLSESAFGATPATVSQVDDQETIDTSQASGVPAPRRYAKRFRAGKMGRDDGFRPGKWFGAPKKARRMWTRKIARYLENHPKQWAELRKSGKVSVARSCYPASTCWGAELYSRARENATCVAGTGYPAYTDACRKGDPLNARGLTIETLQKIGAVILCGGAVGIGAVTSTASAGTTAFIAVWGATSCAWSFWMGFD